MWTYDERTGENHAKRTITVVNVITLPDEWTAFPGKQMLLSMSVKKLLFDCALNGHRKASRAANSFKRVQSA